MKPKTVGRLDGWTPVQRPVEPPFGVIHGTSISTMDGDIPVEYLSVGDRMISRETGMVRITKLCVGSARFRPILISQSSLGHGRPQDDLLVHPKQKLLIRDWRAQALYGAAQALVAAEDLIDGEFIRFAEDSRRYRYTAIGFDRTEVLYADGVEIGSHHWVTTPEYQTA